jgi:hypothetical protein
MRFRAKVVCERVGPDLGYWAHGAEAKHNNLRALAASTPPMAAFLRRHRALLRKDFAAYKACEEHASGSENR